MSKINFVKIPSGAKLTQTDMKGIVVKLVKDEWARAQEEEKRTGEFSPKIPTEFWLIESSDIELPPPTNPNGLSIGLKITPIIKDASCVSQQVLDELHPRIEKEVMEFTPSIGDWYTKMAIAYNPNDFADFITVEPNPNNEK